jgi:hypothetical protein
MSKNIERLDWQMIGGILAITTLRAVANRADPTDKVFKVVGQNMRDCFICEQFLTRQASAEHAKVVCWPEKHIPFRRLTQHAGKGWSA